MSLGRAGPASSDDRKGVWGRGRNCLRPPARAPSEALALIAPYEDRYDIDRRATKMG